MEQLKVNNRFLLLAIVLLVILQSNANASCTYTLSPASYGLSASNGTGNVTVTPSSSNCTWTATTSDSWITITSGSSSTGTANVSYSVAANTTGLARKGTITIGGQTLTIRQAAVIFYDDPNDMFTPYIYAISTEGITKGCWGDPNYFCPGDVVTRGAMAAFIIRTKYGDDFRCTQTPYFTDVPESNGYFKYVQKMKDEGITGNVGTYNWTDVVIREHMAAFLGRAFLGTSSISIAAYELRLISEPEVVIASGQYGLYCFPDGHMSFRRTPEGVDVWFASGSDVPAYDGGTVHFQGSSFEALAPYPSSNGKAVAVLSPSGSGFDQTYAGATSILTAVNGTDLLMIYHAESKPCGLDRDPDVGIGLARSSDGGLTWTRQGQIISPSRIPPACSIPGSRFQGAGNPGVVMSRDQSYYYLYYVEWLSDEPDQIRLARSPVSAEAAPGSWTKYYHGSFSQPGLGGLSDPVIRRPNPEDVTVYTGFPSVSFNLSLDRYLAVFNTSIAFYYSASADGINWEPARSLLANENIPGYPEGTWFCYPSLFSLDQSSDRTTTDTGYLYYSQGVLNVSPHFMERRAFEIVRGGMEMNTDRPGMDYKDFDLSSPDPTLCENSCQQDQTCKAWTYVKPGVQGQMARCCLKSDVPATREGNCCVSGVML